MFIRVRKRRMQEWGWEPVCVGGGGNEVEMWVTAGA